MNVIEKTIGLFSPQTALARMQARMALDLIGGDKRSFHGSSKGERFSEWKRPSSNADSALSYSLPMLRNSMRDLSRNNPWAGHAIDVIQNNTIGTGVLGELSSKKKTKAQMMTAQELWTEWTGTTAIDADNRLNLVGIESLCIRTIVESGEVLLRRRYRRSNSGLPIPVEIQVLEPDYLDNSRDGDLKNGGYIKEGIEYNKQGKRVAYYLFTEHPGDQKQFMRNFSSVRVGASDIIHAFDPKRPGQSRGYPWGAPSIKRLKDFDDYEDAQLVRQKIAACYAGFIHDISTSSGGSTGLSKDGPSQDQRKYMQPGMFENLPAGKSITLSSPPSVQNYSEYAKGILMGIAASYGITYEAFTQDYGNVNFSSGRMGWIEMSRNVTRWQDQLMRGQILSQIKSWFMGGLTLVGVDNSDLDVKWIFPRREMIDPTKEIPAMIKSIRGGITSLPRVHASLGLNSDEILDEIAESNKKLDDKKIILDSDPRNVNLSGSFNEESSRNPDPED